MLKKKIYIQEKSPSMPWYHWNVSHAITKQSRVERTIITLKKKCYLPQITSFAKNANGWIPLDMIPKFDGRHGQVQD